MNTKFEFTGEVNTQGLKRIRAKIAIGFLIKAGDLGGWLQNENNLEVSGDAWVFGDARVFGNARVSGDAQVFGDARVFGDAQVFGDARVSGDAWVFGDARVSGDAWVFGDARVFGDAWVSGDARIFGDARVQTKTDIFFAGPLGSRKSQITAFRCEAGFKISTGCFLGSSEDFMKQVVDVHEDNDHARLYRAFVEMSEYIFKDQS